MKRKITALIIGLLLLLPLAIAVNTLPDGNTDTLTDGTGGTTQAEQEADLSEICDSYTMTVNQDKSFTYCDTIIDLTFDPDSGDLTINDNPVEFGDSYKSDGLTVDYEGFENGKATLTMAKSFEKILGSFEGGKFKVFYDEDAKFAKSADATTDFLAQITYGDSNAYIKIRSSTPSKLTLGINFESPDKKEKLHLPWNISRTNIRALLKEKIETSEQSPELFELTTGDNALTLALDSIEYKIELAPMPEDPEVNAIKIYSSTPFLVKKSLGTKETNTIWITTKLAGISPDEEACKYSIAEASLDDFTRRSSVQGYYPSTNMFFDTFTDYCNDESTLINYGCVGLTGPDWASTSRVAFLEVTCNCANGACAEDPYCVETDKHAEDPYSVKGVLTIYKPGQPTGIPGYENGMELFKGEQLTDSCSNGVLTEYKCNLNDPGYTTETITCTSGCQAGACTGEPAKLIEEEEEEPSLATSPVRDDLIELRDMITLLENSYEEPAEEEPAEESWWGGLWGKSDEEAASAETAPRGIIPTVRTTIKTLANRFF